MTNGAAHRPFAWCHPLHLGRPGFSHHRLGAKHTYLFTTSLDGLDHVISQWSGHVCTIARCQHSRDMLLKPESCISYTANMVSFQCTTKGAPRNSKSTPMANACRTRICEFGHWLGSPTASLCVKGAKISKCFMPELFDVG